MLRSQRTAQLTAIDRSAVPSSHGERVALGVRAKAARLLLSLAEEFQDPDLKIDQDGFPERFPYGGR